MVVGVGNLNIYLTASVAIETFRTAPEGSVEEFNAAQQAAENLAQIANVVSPFNLNAANWVLNNSGTYHLASIPPLERVCASGHGTRRRLNRGAGCRLRSGNYLRRLQPPSATSPIRSGPLRHDWASTRRGATRRELSSE